MWPCRLPDGVTVAVAASTCHLMMALPRSSWSQGGAGIPVLLPIDFKEATSVALTGQSNLLFYQNNIRQGF